MTALTMGVDSFTLLDLLRKATAHKGLELREDASRAYSEPIRTYALDDKLLAILAEQGIRQQDHRNHEIFTLVDENPQEKIPGYAPSNYWNFKLLEGSKREFNLQVTLHVGLGIDLEKRGIVLIPLAFGSFVSAGDPLPHFRMFKALTESDEYAPAVAKELATASNGNIVVTWTELGLGGICKLSHLFAELVGQNKIVRWLGQSGDIFDPAPNPCYQQPGDELFIAEPAQPKIIQAWRTQLNEFRAHLVV